MLDIKSIVTCIQEDAKLEADVSVGILKTMPEVKSISSYYRYDEHDGTAIRTKELHVEFYIFGLTCHLYTKRQCKWVLEATDGRYDSKVLATFWWDARTGNFTRHKRYSNIKTDIEDYVCKCIEKVCISISYSDGPRYAIPYTFKIETYTVHTINSEIILKDERTGMTLSMYNTIRGVCMRPCGFPNEVMELIENNYMINRK